MSRFWLDQSWILAGLGLALYTGWRGKVGRGIEVVASVSSPKPAFPIRLPHWRGNWLIALLGWDCDTCTTRGPAVSSDDLGEGAAA